MSQTDTLLTDYKDQPAFAEAMGSVIVPGTGPDPARVAIVGEAPGDREERAERPFQGPEGQLLDAMLKQAGLSPADFWRTYVVKLRPFDPEDKKYRSPNAEEVFYSLPYLKAELALISCSVVLAMGRIPAEALTGRRISPERDHGLFFDGEYGQDIFVTHSPAAAMFRGPMKQELREDILHFAKEIS